MWSWSLVYCFLPILTSSLRPWQVLAPLFIAMSQFLNQTSYCSDVFFVGQLAIPPGTMQCRKGAEWRSSQDTPTELNHLSSRLATGYSSEPLTWSVGRRIIGYQLLPITWTSFHTGNNTVRSEKPIVAIRKTAQKLLPLSFSRFELDSSLLNSRQRPCLVVGCKIFKRIYFYI